MCVVSMVGDDFTKRWPDITPDPWRETEISELLRTTPEISREEFEEVKKEIEALKKLLKAAKIYDEETGQPDCEAEDKVKLIRGLMELVGVDPEDII